MWSLCFCFEEQLDPPTQPQETRRLFGRNFAPFGVSLFILPPTIYTPLTPLKLLTPKHPISLYKLSSSASPLCLKPTMLLVLFFFFFLFSLSVSAQKVQNNSLSLSFPLTLLPPSTNISSQLPSSHLNISNSKISTKRKMSTATTSPSYNVKSTFKYSMALVVSLPIGTPPQVQEMVLDTGSQLSWFQCHDKKKATPPPTSSFDPSLSSSFSVLPCDHPVCKPRVPDYTLPTSCDQNRLCHYSYFYADGTYAEGNLVKEKFTFTSSLSTPALILGCSSLLLSLLTSNPQLVGLRKPI